MSHRTRLLQLVLCVATTASFACGDDSEDTKPKPDAGSVVTDAGDKTPRRPPIMRTDAGMIVGTGEEGATCATAGDCAKDLACVAYTPMLSVCARGCASDSDCGSESCQSATGLPEDAHCINFVREPYGVCGATETSVCGNGTCLTLAPGFGICVDICDVDSNADGGVADTADAGSLPDLIVECGAAQTCAGDLDLTLTTGESVGFCATRADRGEDCGLEKGVLCETGNVCIPSDPEDLMSTGRCYQDCSERGAVCDKGTCTDFRGQFAYCL